MLGFSILRLYLNALLHQFLCGRLLTLRRRKRLPCRLSKPSFTPFLPFLGPPSHFSDSLRCCYQQLCAYFKPTAALVCQQTPLVGQAGPSLAGAYLCACLMIRDFSTALCFIYLKGWDNTYGISLSAVFPCGTASPATTSDCCEETQATLYHFHLLSPQPEGGGAWGTSSGWREAASAEEEKEEEAGMRAAASARDCSAAVLIGMQNVHRQRAAVLQL